MSHVPTPYQCSNRNWRNEESFHWYITGDHYEDEDGDPVCTSVATVPGNPTSAPVTQHTAEFLVRAANAHEEMLKALEAVWTTLAQSTTASPPPIVLNDLCKTAREAWLKGKGDQP